MRSLKSKRKYWSLPCKKLKRKMKSHQRRIRLKWSKLLNFLWKYRQKIKNPNKHRNLMLMIWTRKERSKIIRHKFRFQSQRTNVRNSQNLLFVKNLNRNPSSSNRRNSLKQSQINNSRSMIHQSTKLRTSNLNLYQTNNLKTKRKKIHLQANTIKSLDHSNNPIKNHRLFNLLFNRNLKMQMTKEDPFKEKMIEKVSIQGTL